MAYYTQEQLEMAKRAKSPEELVAMAKEQGLEITLEQAAGFLEEPGLRALSAEELGNVAGGGCGGGGGKPDYRQMAQAEGRSIWIFRNDKDVTWRKEYKPNGPCGCGITTILQSLYAEQLYDYQVGYSYFNCKCYACGKTWDKISVTRY